LLFIHGAGGNSKIWERQIKFFGNAIAIDLPGHGVGEGKKTIEEYVEEVKKFCDENNLKNLVIIGHSMGGAIALEFALNHIEYLKALVLVCTGAKLRVAPIIFETLKTNYAQAVELVADYVLGDKATDEIKMKVKEEMRNMSPQVVYSDFEACDKFNVMDRLNEIKVPTLIICGSKDKLTPLKYAKYLRDNIQNSKLKIIRAGHMVMLEKPDEFNEKLEGFIKELNKLAKKSRGIEKS